ncbi:MAG: sulfotransferase [Rhodothermales bacterium]
MEVLSFADYDVTVPRKPVVDYGIVLGCPRSGTTYLMRLLNTLPQAECLIGTIISTSLPQIARQKLDPAIYNALAVSFERSLDAYLHSGQFNSRASAIQKWFNAPNGLGNLIKSAKGKRNITRMIFKEPFLSFAPDFVNDAVPDAKVIYIYRDGRDVANSLMRTYDVLSDESLEQLFASEMRLGRKVDNRHVPWWIEEDEQDEFLASKPYVRAIWMWKYMVGYCNAFYGQDHIKESGKVMMLKYEDLMRQPQEYGMAILNHLDEEPSPAYYKMLKKAHAKSIGKHKKRDKSEIAAAERIAGKELSDYGYL